MNKYNSGLAPLAIVLIVAVVLVIGGGGVYVATHSKAKVATGTSVSPTVTMTTTPSATPTVSVSQTPKPTPKPVVVVSVKYATVGDAVRSGKTVSCVGPWATEGKGGSNLYRSRYTITRSSIHEVIEFKNPTTGAVSTVLARDYTPGVQGYDNALTYSLTTSTCTQK